MGSFLSVTLASILLTPQADTAIQPSDKPKNASHGIVFVPDPNDLLDENSISDVAIHAEVAGPLVRFHYELTIQNEQKRQMEASIVFQLPYGSTISGYALKVGDQWVDGVSVARRDATRIFNTEMSRRIDPGLVEWLGNQSFRTRIWPVPSQSTRKIRLEYVAELASVFDAHSDKHELEMKIPVRFENALKSLEIDVDLPGVSVVRMATSGQLQPQTTRTPTGFKLHASGKNKKWNDDLVVRIESQSMFSFVDRASSGADYFVVSDSPEFRFREKGKSEVERVDLRGPIAVYWDASASRQDDDFGSELKLLHQLIQEFGSEFIELTIFRNAAESPILFSVDAKNPTTTADDIVRLLRDTPFDGGTKLDSLTIARTSRLRAGKDFRWAFLFSDGLSGSGSGEERLPALEMPAQVFASAKQANQTLLGLIASGSDGNLFDVAKHDGKQVIERLSRTPYYLKNVEFNSKEIADVSSTFCPSQGGRISVVGRMLTTGAKVKFTFAHVGAPDRCVEVALQKKSNSQSREFGDRLATLWAQKRLANPGNNSDLSDDIRHRLSKQFAIVTPSSSLLVLENLSQYLEYRVEPPKSWSSMYQQWTQNAFKSKIDFEAEERQYFSQMPWRAFLNWWNSSFQYPGRMPDWYAGTNLNPAVARYYRINEEDFVRAQLEMESLDRQRSKAVCDARGYGGLGSTSSSLPDARPADSSTRQIFGEQRSPVAIGSQQPAGATKSTVTSNSQSKDNAFAFDSSVLRSLQSAEKGKAYQEYLRLRQTLGHHPLFYLHAAKYFQQNQMTQLARRIRSNLEEWSWGNGARLRPFALYASAMGDYEGAVELMEQACNFEPGNRIINYDLAQLLTARADSRRRNNSSPQKPECIADYLRAVELFQQIARGNRSMSAIQITALIDANRNLSILSRFQNKPEWLNTIDRKLLVVFDLDIRVLLFSDAGTSNLELVVEEPTGEVAEAGHELTKIGGKLMPAASEENSPLQYLLRRAVKGPFAIKVKRKGSLALNSPVPQTVYAVVITNFGRANERREMIAVVLNSKDSLTPIHTIDLSKIGAE